MVLYFGWKYTPNHLFYFQQKICSFVLQNALEKLVLAMKKTISPRRSFIKLSAMGLGSLAVAPLTAGTQQPVAGNSTVDKKLHIVCVGAHPGDPEFGCGGTMAKYSDAGHQVTFLYLTRGEASDPKIAYSDMAALRTKEAATSCKILNATALFAGQVDGNTVLNKASNEEMAKLLLNEKPDIVFTQWPVDAHPDHQVAGLLVLTAWTKAERNFHLYFYEVNTGVETMGFTPTDYVDITNVQDRKKQAMFAHQTQSPVETYTSYFKPLEEFRGLEAGVKAAEAFVHFKARDSRASIIGI
jgi:LmbE family N-acetylglucosaminyl deacetylase